MDTRPVTVLALPSLAARRHFPVLRHASLDGLRSWRGKLFGERPAFVFFDTGAAARAAIAERYPGMLPSRLLP